ncbi:MAG: hypothetical protein PUC34_00770 [Paludibacteraceae bacterium]|nr:hypothetical protein [Paludibacteraceae bacterium]MDD6747309.1 hypothetical protein [Paludibacteraceae bacterium]
MTTNIFSLLKNQKSVVLALWTAVVLLFAAPQGAMAEKHTVGPYTADSDNGWEKGFNGYASPYMSISTISNDASIKNGDNRYMAPQGTGDNTNGYVTFKTAPNTYIQSYSFGYFFSGTSDKVSVCGDPKSNTAYIRQGTTSSGTTLVSAITGSGKYTSSNFALSSTVSFFLNTPSTPSGRCVFVGWSGVQNSTGINDITFNMLIPEVLAKSELYEETDNSLDKIKTKGDSITKDYTYKVADYKDTADFKVTLTKMKGSASSTFSATIQSVSNGVLTVHFSYTTASTTNWQEDYSFDLLVESKNTVNTKSFTTHINGSATDQKSANTLAFLISKDQKVNTTYSKEKTVSSNNTTKAISLESSDPRVAFFDEYDILNIVGSGKTTLTATQDETEEIASASVTLDLDVSRRQVELWYNPAGALYTGCVYNNYVNVRNDVNNTCPALSYSLDTDAYINITEDATVTAKLTPGSTTLKISSSETTEWAATDIDTVVEVVKDPAALDIYLTENVYKDFIKENSFCQKKLDNGTIAVTDDNKLRIGEANDRELYTSTYEIHFKGIPKDLSFTYSRPTAGFFEGSLGFINAADENYTLTIQESDEEGDSWNTLYTTSTSGATGATTVEKALKETTRRICITYIGVRYVYFTNFCINAKKDFSVPDSATITQSASGFIPEKFELQHSMMKSISVTSTNDHFTVSPATLGMADGLGYGNGTIQLQVSYTGSDISETTTLNFTGTDMDDNPINKSMTVSLVHPAHYVKGKVVVYTGNGKVHIASDNTVPASSAYVGGGGLTGASATMSTATLECDHGATTEGDTKTFTLRAIPDDKWFFSEWRDAAGNTLSMDNPYTVSAAANSTDSENPTTYTYNALFFGGYREAPKFLVNDLSMGETKSGQSIQGNVQLTGDPNGVPRYFLATDVSIRFEDIAGHTGEAAHFSAGTYNKGTLSFPITFDPRPNKHLTDRTYQAKAVVTATNDEYDENGDRVGKRTTTHDCIVTVVCHPADMVSFSVPGEIDFGYVETVTQLGSALVLSNVENMVGEPTLTLSNTVFTKVLYDEISHTFALGYEFHAGQEGQLTATATVTAYNYDGVAVTSDPIILKVVANKPQFTVNDLSMGSMVSGDEPIHAYLPLGDPHGIDPTQVTINITDAPGHSGESSVFSSLAYDAVAQSFYITFAPVGAHVDVKNYQAQATISATNIVGTTSITVLLNATVLPSAPATYTVADSHAFGSLQRNQSETWQAVLSNIENAGEELPTINFDGPNASYFSASAYDPVSHSFTITFTPLAVNPSCSATAHVIVKNYDGKPTEKTITLTGTCVPAPAATFDVQNAEHESVVGTGVYFGDFNEGDAATRTLYIANLLNIKEGTVPAISIAPDGKFAAAAYNATTKSFDITFTALEGMETVQNAVATFTVLNNDDQVTEKTVPLSAFVVQTPDFDVRVTDSEGNLIEGGETTWTLGLALANKAANAGCTVTLMRAVTGLTAYQEIKNTFTLDLNGKKLSGKINNGSIIYINSAGKTLTIKDSKSDGRIENINNTNSGIAYGVNLTAGSLVLHSGTIYVENKGASGRKAVGILNEANTNLTINGGKVEVYGYNDSYGISQKSDKDNNTTFTMNAGEIAIEGYSSIMGILAYGKVNVNGGTINATATYRYSYGIRMYASSNATPANCYWGTLNMTGGTINSNCTRDENTTREAYGVFFDCANTGMGTDTAADKSHANKAAAVGSITNATINVSTNSRYAYGVIAYGSYQSKTNTYDKIKINNSTINATAKYYYAYGVYACGGINTTHGAKYFANIELTDCDVTATTTTYYGTYAVWAYATYATVYKNSQPNYYGEYAGGATVTINSGTYTANSETSDAYAVGTSARARTIYDSETSVSAERKLGGNAEGYATLNIHGGTFRANAKTSTARAVSNGGNCTIDGGEFYATTGTSSAEGIYTVSGKLVATGAKIDVTAGTSTAYGVRVNVSGPPTGNQAWTGFTYHGDAVLNNLDVTVTTSTGSTAYGVFVNSTVGTYTQTAFDNQRTASSWSDDTYTIYSRVFPGDNTSFADAGIVSINGGKYTVSAATTTAYGVYLAQTSVSNNNLASAAAQGTIKNATFNVTTNGTTYAFGIRSGGDVTIDGCNIKVQPKTTTAYGVYMDNNTATITNTTLDVKGTTTAYALYANASINSTNGYDYHGRFDLGEGNNVTAAATAGNTAHVLTLIASKRNIASGTFAGDYANAATAIVRDGSYKATATGTTTYVLNLSANQVQGAVSAAPSCTIEGGKFWATASGGTQGVCTSNGVAGNILIKGGVYNINTYLGTFLAPGYDEVPIESGRAEYTEGYRYEVLPAGPHGTYVCQIGTGTKYKTLEEALTAVKSGEVIHMLANYTLPAGDYILPTGATLMVPYKDGTGKGASTAIGNSAETTTSATTPVLFRKLTFGNGVNLVCYGTIETSAQQKANGAYGACVGMPSGAYGQIHLEEGAHIELESGSRLNCWGYITGKGTINVKNGATSLEGFQLGDWCGGSNAASLNNNSDKVFPITHYFYQSIECPITYRPGAKAIGSTHVYAASTVAGQDAIGLVGTSGSMFLMTPEDASKDTWVMKDYDETTDQCIWTINNGASVGNLSISMSAGFISYNFQSANYDLPITTNMTIVMNYGEMGISQNAVLLPGAQWIVNKEGTANIDGVSLVAYDVDDWTGTKRYFASYSPTWGTNNPRKNIALQDAEVFVHGKVNIKSNGGLYTTAGGANVHSTNEDAGEVIYTTKAQDNKTTKYLQQGGTTRVSLTAYPAMLKNGVGMDPAFSESAGTVAGKTWIYYDNQWQCWTQDEYCIYRDNEGHPYAKPDGYVALNEQEADVDYASLIHDAATGTHAYIWDADCYWWEVNPTPVEEGIYRSINEDHNGKLNCYEFNKNGWCWEIKNVTVTWNGEGVTTTSYTNVGYGTSPKWFGATPVKSGYVWDGWQINGAGTVYSNDDLPLVTANTTFTSHFKQNPVLYNITFKNPDGTVLDSRNWESGSTPSYEGTPTQNPTAGENYTWNGTWSPTITTVTAATEYTAQYNSTTRQYDVTFLDYNNEELEKKKVNYNVAPTYTGDPSTPTREDSTDTYIYEFSGWKNQQTETTGLAAVKGDQTYVAQYTHHKKWFNIRFVDYNGTTLKTGPVLRNTMPTPPANPTRESDAQYDYSFKAWSPTIVAATENATYTATYNMALRSYTVRFLNYDGTVLQTETLDYGTTPSYKGETPTYADESKEFIGWDDVMRSVDRNKDYTAQYTTKTYTITVTSAGNGSVAGGGVYSHGSVATLTATPEEGFAFDHWNDDNTDNPRSLTVTATATYTATFVSDETGDYLDIVDWTNNTVTINANGWTASGWPYTVNGTPYAKNSRNADRTLTIPYSGDAGTNLTISVASGSVISKRKYSIPFINTIDGTTETSVVYVNSGKLTIDGSKTLAAVYVAPGAELEITGSLTVGKLFLRTDNAQSAILTNTGTLTATNVYYTRITRSNATYDQFGLPLDCALSSVTMSNAGKLGSSEMPYGSAWNLKSYNEASRAEYGKQDDGSNWTLLAADATIKGGTGYQMMSTSKYFREYHFPVDLSQLGNSVPVSYTEGAAGPDHRGWNIICSPLTSVYKVISADPATGIKLNWLEPAGDAYVQEPADTILPARPFAFQTTESCTKLVFNNDHSLVYQAPRRVAAADNTETEWLHLDIKDANNRGDQTSLYVHPSRFDEVYEAGVDVAKLSFSASHALLYSTHAYGEMAFAGVADELLEQGVALTVYSPKAQELTISMRENEWLHRMTFVWLIDKATGAQIDLLESDYSFSAEAGTTAGRFILMGAFFAPQITTDNGTVQGDEDIKAKKFIYKDKMYIQINGLIYDATGKLVK